MIYFDNAATTMRKPPEMEKVLTAAIQHMGNSGRGAHGATLDASRMIFDTRLLLAQIFGMEEPGRIAFTANATQSLNIAIHGLFKQGDHVVSTVCEHNSVLRPLYRKMEEGVEITLVPTTGTAEGTLDYDALEAAVKKNTRAIVITHASNLTGNITDLQRVSAVAKRHGILLVVDASQTAGVVPIDVQAMGIDVLCFTGHKGLLGPQGTGGIYLRPGIEMKPLLVGGSGVHSFDKNHPSQMPTALEAGTLNGHGIAGLSGALEYLKKTGIENIREREMRLTAQFLKGIKEIPGMVLYGNPDLNARVATVALNLGNLDSGEVSDWLWEAYEIAVRPGAHCAPLMHEALGTREQGAVRFSFSHYNTEEEVDTAITALWELAGELE
jgi:cysteine desulfurase family protein